MMMSAFYRKNAMSPASATCAEAFSGCASSRTYAMTNIAVIMDAVLASIFVALFSVVIVRNVVVVSILDSIIVSSIILVSIILISVLYQIYTPRHRGHA